jgi:hypothetical protein
MQEAIVAIIVACASWVVLKRYAPKTLKQAMRIQAARACKTMGWKWAETRIESGSDAGGSCADGCGPCGGCGTKPAPGAEQKIVFTPRTPQK